MRELQKVRGMASGCPALLCFHPTSANARPTQQDSSRSHNPSLQALSDAHTYLFDERERLLALQAENDTLKLQEMADRQRIKQLLSLTRPSEQQVVFQQENAAVQACTALPQRQQQQRSKSPSGRGRGNGGGGERILRTVYLPAAQTEPLTLKCEALQAQLAEQVRSQSTEWHPLVARQMLLSISAAAALSCPFSHACCLASSIQRNLASTAEPPCSRIMSPAQLLPILPDPPPVCACRMQKQFAAEKMAALAEDRQLRERDMEAQMKAATQTMQELEQRLKGAEEALRRTTKDYILGERWQRTVQVAADLPGIHD